MAKTRTIEIDEQTARTLESRAAERGVSVSQLLADIANVESAPLAVTPEDITELDRRWAAVATREATVSNEQVVRWLETWGTSAFKPWREQ